MAVDGISSFTLVCAGVLFFMLGFCESGCREAGLCCSGRETSCSTRGWRSDRMYGTCFCDQACRSTMDCCHDYHTACPGLGDARLKSEHYSCEKPIGGSGCPPSEVFQRKCQWDEALRALPGYTAPHTCTSYSPRRAGGDPAVSCVVSGWSQWSGCSEPCRATIRRRSRTVQQGQVNGGNPCPHLEELAGCAEYWSQQGHCHNLLVPALITSGGYGNARKKRDIPDSGDISGYCIQFQLTSMTSGCQRSGGPHTHWMQRLREGHQVCVECQPPALSAGHKHCAGDGEEPNSDNRSQSLQWQAVGNPQCRGVWRRVGRQEACSCPTAHSFLFI